MGSSDLEGLAPKKLYIVAAPIGNVDDLSYRARLALQEASTLIFCEDKRKVQELFRRLNLVNSDYELLALPGDREFETDFRFFLTRGFSQWLFISDAGTACLNDPGKALTQFARDEGISVVSLPGPSAPMALWQWSGGAFGLPIAVAGFVPKGTSKKKLQDFFALAKMVKSFIFFDSKHQIKDTLDFLAGHADFKESALIVGREMTKAHEEILFGKIDQISEQVGALLKTSKVGELTLIIEGQNLSADCRPSGVDLKTLTQIRTSKPKIAAKLMSEQCGESVRDCYDVIVGSKEES